MFLAQNLKKFLKGLSEGQENTDKKGEDLYNRLEDIENACGLDPDDTSSDPAFHHLIGNSWHFILGDVKHRL